MTKLIDKIVRIGELKSIVSELNALWNLSSHSLFEKGSLHNFARGLIFSEKIIQIIYDNINQSRYKVGWGQIVEGGTGKYLSNECDVIIYEGSPYKEWGKHSMKYVLVEHNRVKLVIQCTTTLDSISTEHKNFCKSLKKIAPNKIWYCAECCIGSRNKLRNDRSKLKKCGYTDSFILRRIDDRNISIEELNNIDWLRFIKIIRNKFNR